MNKLAFVFPGQGSQHIGMLSEHYSAHEAVRSTFEEASDALGLDLWAICSKGPDDKLNSTDITQPALLTASTAVWRVLQGLDIPKPALLAGHSLGEFSALVAAGSLKFDDAVRLVHARGKLMIEAVPNGEGTMAAILGLSQEAIEKLCLEVSGQLNQVVQCVNYNAPGQIVIAGHTPAVELACKACKEAGAKRAIVLNVSGPFHSSLMSDAAQGFEAALTKLDVVAPEIPVVQNVTNIAETDPKNIAANLVKQLSAPVDWIGAVSYLINQGVNSITECGAGKVLTGLNKRIDKTLTLYSSESVASYEKFVNTLAEADN